jgi:predicted nucleotidyltransferase
MEPDVAVLVDRVGRALTQIHGVRVAYLFGSRVTGRVRADSDLDLAVLFDPSLDAGARLRVELDIVAALTDALGPVGERTDVVDLGRAGSGVAFRAIREGQCVLARDPAERVRLVARIARLYDEDAPRRDFMRRAAITAARRLGAEAPGRP